MSATAPGRHRLGCVDAFKAVASQLIVLHHLAFYGPMSDVVMAWAPATIEAFARHGRLAVQIFLVIGGFLAARQLAPQARWAANASAARLVLDRYLRLVLPYAAALAITVGCAAFARRWFDHHSLPDPTDALGLFAHLLLLQDLLGIEALSAGVWYLSIDLQSFVLLLALLRAAAWIERRFERRGAAVGAVAPWLVVGSVAGSLFFFNRQPQWDVAAPYFFASYGLGVLAAWQMAARDAATPRVPAWAVAAVLCVALALWIDFRERIALAAAIALVLALPSRGDRRLPGWLRRLVETASRISYALFLVHFGVCLVVNALFTALLPSTPGVQAFGLLVAWSASVLAAWALHERVERPLLRRLGRRSALRGATAAAR